MTAKNGILARHHSVKSLSRTGANGCRSRFYSECGRSIYTIVNCAQFTSRIPFLTRAIVQFCDVYFVHETYAKQGASTKYTYCFSLRAVQLDYERKIVCRSVLATRDRDCPACMCAKCCANRLPLHAFHSEAS